MKMIRDAIAGTLESSDLLVKVSPSGTGTREIVVRSEVFKRFGRQITLVVTDTLDKLSVSEGSVVIDDKGALDCVIRARVRAAVLRGAGADHSPWERRS